MQSEADTPDTVVSDKEPESSPANDAPEGPSPTPDGDGKEASEASPAPEEPAVAEDTGEVTGGELKHVVPLIVIHELERGTLIVLACKHFHS